MRTDEERAERAARRERWAARRERKMRTSWRGLPGFKCHEPTSRSGGKRRCPVLAGWDTTHAGFGRCATHEKRGERAAWRTAMELSRELNVPPWDALLRGVSQAVARAEWVDYQLQQAVNGADGAVETSPEVKRWLAESRKERTLVGRLSKAAIDAGVAERLVRQVELEGQLVMNAVVAALDRLDLPHEQRMLALDAAADALLAPQGSAETTTVLGTVVHDDRARPPGAESPGEHPEGGHPGSPHGGRGSGSEPGSGLNTGDLGESDEADRDPTEDERD